MFKSLKAEMCNKLSGDIFPLKAFYNALKKKKI